MKSLLVPPAAAIAITSLAIVALAAPAPVWMKDVTTTPIPNAPVTGRIHGKPFRVDRADLVRGILTLREGKDRFPLRAISIYTSIDADGKLEGKAIRVKPVPLEKQARTTLHVIMEYQPDDAKPTVPKTEMLMADYSLSLAFGKTKNGKLPGRIYLSLPDKDKSFVAGTFVAVVSESGTVKTPRTK